MSAEDQSVEKSSLWSRAGDVLEDVGFVIYRAVLGMMQSNVTIMASGLVYSTLVAIVPCMTFCIAFLTTFGILQPFMDALGELFSDLFGPVMGSQLMGLIDQFSNNAMGLGVFGLVSFLITATFLVNKVYTVINQIFRTQPGSTNLKRFTSFLTFLLVGVVCLALLIAVNSSIMGMITSRLTGDVSQSSFLANLLSLTGSLVVVCVILFLLYYFVPSTKVRFRSACLGSVLSALSLVILFNVFKMVVSRMVSYSVIYGSMASLLFVFLFLYACWYIILTGAEVIYVHQFRPESGQLSGGPEVPARQVADAVNMMMLIGRGYKEGSGATSRKDLTRRLAITPSNLSGYISLLVKSGLIIEINEGKAASYVPSRPLDQIFLREIFDSIYGFDSQGGVDTAGEAVSELVYSSSNEAMNRLTLENLLERI